MMTQYKLTPNGVIREDGAYIPDEPGNRDWQKYQAWLVAGNEPDLMDIPLLADLQATAKIQIDRHAGVIRGKYITTVPGQEATYTEKARQCDAYKSAGYPANPDPVVHSYVIAEKNARGGPTTFKQAADAILAERDQWAVVGANIEEARRKAKLAIDAAQTEAAVETAREAGIAALTAL